MQLSIGVRVVGGVTFASVCTIGNAKKPAQVIFCMLPRYTGYRVPCPREVSAYLQSNGKVDAWA